MYDLDKRNSVIAAHVSTAEQDDMPRGTIVDSAQLEKIVEENYRKAKTMVDGRGIEDMSGSDEEFKYESSASEPSDPDAELEETKISTLRCASEVNQSSKFKEALTRKPTVSFWVNKIDEVLNEDAVSELSFDEFTLGQGELSYE